MGRDVGEDRVGRVIRRGGGDRERNENRSVEEKSRKYQKSETGDTGDVKQTTVLNTMNKKCRVCINGNVDSNVGGNVDSNIGGNVDNVYYVYCVCFSL